jgi:hypothetical protein
MSRARLRELGTIAALALVFGTATLVLHGAAAKALAPAVLPASFAFYATALMAGVATLMLLPRARPEIAATEALLTGTLLVSCLLLALAFLSRGGILVHALVVATVTAATYAAAVRRSPAPLALGRHGALAIAVTLVASALWSFENLQGLVVATTPKVSHPWVDVFFHAQRIALFARASGPATLDDPSLSGIPLPPYHYASYLPPAFVAAATGVDAYGLAASVLPTLGTQLTGLAAYTMGAAWFGPAGGLLATLGLLLVPDPSFLGLGSRWTSYYFHQQVGPSGSYAVAALGLAWVWALRAARDRSLSWAIAAVAACGAVALFKVQIAAAYALGLLLFVAASLPSVPRRVVAMAAVLVAAAGAFHLSRHVSGAPTLALSSDGLQSLLALLASRLPPWLVAPWSSLLPPDSGEARRLLIGVPLIVVGIYGPWLVVAAVAAGRVLRMEALRPTLWFPAITLASHLAVLTLLAPNRGPHGDPHEIILKTFVWPYFALAVWGSGALAGWPSRSALPAHGAWRTAVLVALMIGAVAWCGQRVQAGMAADPKFASYLLMRTPFPPGFVEAARWIREHAGPRDVVQLSGNDGLLAFGALSERGTYFAHPAVNAGPMTEEEKRRYDHLVAIREAGSVAAAARVARGLGIRWLVVSDDVRAGWADDPESEPAFATPGYSVYQLAAVEDRR